jgi:hypothetical protein
MYKPPFSEFINVLCYLAKGPASAPIPSYCACCYCQHGHMHVETFYFHIPKQFSLFVSLKQRALKRLSKRNLSCAS